MSDKKSFLMYKDLDEQLQDLTVTQAGHLFKSVFAYQNKYGYECGDPVVRYALKGLVSQFKRDGERYDKTCASRSEAGRKGGLAKASKRKQKKQKVASLADSDSDSDSDSDTYKEFLLGFNKVTGKRFRVLSEKAKGQLNARIKEGFTFDEIFSAAKTCQEDPHHVKNPKYLTPEFITRLDKLQANCQAVAGDLFTPFHQNGQTIHGEPTCNGLTRDQFIEKYGRVS